MSENPQVSLEERQAELERAKQHVLEKLHAFDVPSVPERNRASVYQELYPLIKRDLEARNAALDVTEKVNPQEIINYIFQLQIADYMPSPQQWAYLLKEMPQTACFLQELTIPKDMLPQFNADRLRFRTDLINYIDGRMEMHDMLRNAVGAELPTLEELRARSLALRAEQQQP